jgi:hypothetical protein
MANIFIYSLPKFCRCLVSVPNLISENFKLPIGVSYWYQSKVVPRTVFFFLGNTLEQNRVANIHEQWSFDNLVRSQGNIFAQWVIVHFGQLHENY